MNDYSIIMAGDWDWRDEFSFMFYECFHLDDTSAFAHIIIPIMSGGYYCSTIAFRAWPA